MSADHPHLSVIIPAYNEELRIPKTLEAIHAYLLKQAFSWEVVIVLDGTTDNTLGVIESFADGKEGFRWIDRKQNRGKGFTIRQGMQEAVGEIRLYTDADNSTDLSHFDLMRPLFADGHQIVICSRDSKDLPEARQAIPQPFWRRFFGDMGNLYIQLMAVRGIWDTQCGFKAFSAESAEKIFSRTTIDHYAIDIEALALGRRFGYTIGIVGANWINDENSHVKFRDYLVTLKDTTRIRWNLMTGVYQ